MKLEKAKEYHDLYRQITEARRIMQSLKDEDTYPTQIDIGGSRREVIFLREFPNKIKKAVKDSLKNALSNHIQEMEDKLEEI
jgi:hypothetical protein